MNLILAILLFLLSLSGSEGEGGNPSLKLYVNDGPSMTPTIHDGDRMVVNTDLSSGISKNDIVVFESEGRSFCKRVVGAEGDTVEIKKSGLYINNELLHKIRVNAYSNQKRVVLKKDEYYVLGDNVDNSYDSRDYGPINAQHMIGKVTKILPNPLRK